MEFWDISARLQDREKSTYVDGISRLSGIASAIEVMDLYVQSGQDSSVRKVALRDNVRR
jgi:hypothetical protein